MDCESCEAVSINGVWCHEHGCPDAKDETVETVKRRVWDAIEAQIKGTKEVV